MLDDGARERLRAWIDGRIGGGGFVLGEMTPLSGGSIQENWRLDGTIAGEPRRFVLRKDAAATIASSRTREEEFAVLEAAHRSGVRVPEPIGFCRDADVVGAPFALMALVEGVGLGPRIVKDLSLGGDRERLAEQLGRELARIHRIRPPTIGLEFLGEPEPQPALAEIRALRCKLDALEAARPALEWGLRWAELHAPACAAPTLTHRDFRTGNYMVDGHGLTAILDWEFAGWGDPMADLGWFCAACWRFGRPDLEAGGIAARAVFYRGYELEGGGPVDHAAVRFWEVMAHLRWAAIALEQAHRHVSGAEFSLELALTGRMVPALELAVLRETDPARWEIRHG
ncbi:phosphotransferase family protein [Methylobacterium nigriterrae]|uniref:phosphotransferase family protein n=1 Tax=Methylobacterium nigriterrae TaxID=3127512 RepID=UPI003013D4F9